MFAELERIAAYKAREAVYYDRMGQTAKAVKRYREAIDLLWKVYNLTQDQALRKVFVEKISQYEARIEELGVAEHHKPAVTQQQKVTFSDTVLRHKPQVSWDDIVNIEEAKKAIRQSIVFPVRRPDLFPLGWPRGILVFGPPGCGKTLLAAAVAKEIDAHYFVVDAATIMSKWLGESEKNVARLFSQARQVASKGKPAIIFIDEVDSLTAERFLEVGGEARVRNQLVKEMDGILSKGKKEYIYVIAATNKPWYLDEPFIRRFQKRIYVPLPDLEARKQLFAMYTSGLKLDVGVDLHQLAVMSDGYSAADIHDVCMEAQLRVVNELFSSGSGDGNPRPITMDDFLEVLKKRRPSIALENMQKLLKWQEKYGTS